MPEPKCKVCNGTGWTGWEKPMSDQNGKIVMVFVPQRCCMCETGLKMANMQQGVSYSVPIK